jgi:Xaa-Pro aminopeptidase
MTGTGGGAGLTAASRLAAVQERLAQTGADGLWVHPSVDLRYLCGIELLSLERPAGLLIPARGPLRLLVPLMLLPQVASVQAEPVAWSDEQGPEGALRQVLGGVRRLLVEPSLPTGTAFLMRAQAPGLELELDPGIIAALRERKQPDEVAKLREAGRLADEMVAWAARRPLNGLTERALSGRMQARFLEHGHPPHPDFIVATGPHAARPHHETGDAPIDPTAPLLLDFGCTVDGYHSDLTRVLLPEPLAPPVAEAYEVVLAAHDAARRTAAPGVPCGEVDRAARTVIEEAGHGERFLHRTGHGLGLEIHEPPYLHAGNPRPLELGHVFSIEPGSTSRASSACGSRRSTTSARTAQSRSTRRRDGSGCGRRRRHETREARAAASSGCRSGRRPRRQHEVVEAGGGQARLEQRAVDPLQQQVAAEGVLEPGPRDVGELGGRLQAAVEPAEPVGQQLLPPDLHGLEPRCPGMAC